MSDIKFECNKENADTDKYYGLFKKHMDDFKDGERILFIHIGNFDVLNKFISSNPNCKYVIIDQYLNGNLFEIYWPRIKFVGSKEDESILTALETLTNMKFDKIIMNPPYNGNAGLYAKITVKALEKSDDVICLSPYLIYMSRNKKKNIIDTVKTLEKHFEEYETVNNANSIFGAVFDKPLAIMHFKKEKTTDISFDDLFFVNRFKDIKTTKSIFKKIEKYCLENDNCFNHIINKKQFDSYKFKCAFAGIRGNYSEKLSKALWDWTTIFDKAKKTNFTIGSNAKEDLMGFPFDNESQCKAMINYWESDIIMFCLYIVKMSINMDKCLFKTVPYILDQNGSMETNENKIISFLNLTNDEVLYIKDEMKEFGWKCKKMIEEQKIIEKR